MTKPNTQRMLRWRFTSVIGSCTMFMKGLGGLQHNPHTTSEILQQAERALAEVHKLQVMVKDVFKK